MCIRKMARRILLSFMLGGGRWLGTQMSQEVIEALLHSAHQVRAEEVISQKEDDGGKPK